MTRTDSLVVGTLVALLAIIASLVSVPSLLPTAASSLRARRDRCPDRARPYREGVLGRPGLGQPVECPHPGRPRPRRAGLLRARPQRPGRLARAGPRRALDGRLDRARSGRSSSATTRAGTTASRSPPRTSRSPSASSRTPTTGVRAPDRGTRSPSRPTGSAPSCSRSTTPLGGFLQAATQPIAPAHLLAGIPVDQLADRPVRSPADRVRAVRGREPERRRRRADPGRHDPPARRRRATRRRRSRPIRWPRRGRPAVRPGRCRT